MLHSASAYIKKLPPRQIICNCREFGQLHSAIEMINSCTTGSEKYVHNHIKNEKLAVSHNYYQRNLAQIPKVAVHLCLQP